MTRPTQRQCFYPIALCRIGSFVFALTNVRIGMLRARLEQPCSPEQQAGDGAAMCPRCKRQAVHTITGECMACKLKLAVHPCSCAAADDVYSLDEVYDKGRTITADNKE
jgi:hypothetical protein